MSSIKEKSRQVWGKVTTATQSGIDQAQAELGKLEAQAAGAPEAGKASIRAKIGQTEAKRDSDMEKMRSNLLEQVIETNIQLGELDRAAAGVTGGAHDKMVHDAEEMRAERDKAWAKLENSLQSEIVEAENEMAALEKGASDASSGAAARILTRVEWARLRRDTVQRWLEEARQQVGAGAPVA